MNKNDTIYIAGASGLVGSAFVRRMKKKGYKNLITDRVELFDRESIDNFFWDNRDIDTVIMCAAKVGGIGANSRSNFNFLCDNLDMEVNLIRSAYDNGIHNFLFLGSSCIYPKNTQLPIKPDQLLTSKLESTNEGYALAKICGIKMCQFIRKEFGFNYHSIMPCNLYGPNDNYDLENCHVLPALIRKVHECYVNKVKSIEIWGSGNPLREFLYSDDLADAGIMLMERNNQDEIPDIVNIGSSKEISIIDLLYTIIGVIKSYRREKWSPTVVCNTNMPDGVYSKIMDSSVIKSYGWEPVTSLAEGIKKTYEDTMANMYMSK